MDDQMEQRGKQLHTITSSLASQTPSSALAKVEAAQDRKMLVAIHLAKLAAHYWRPDFTATQAEMLFDDFVEDLAGFKDEEVETACRLYRQNGANQFFPKPGQLREILLKQRAEDRSMRRISTRPIPESRPLCWWMQPKERWKSHWLESEIPEHDQAAHRAWKTAMENRARETTTPRYSPGTD